GAVRVGAPRRGPARTRSASPGAAADPRGAAVGDRRVAASPTLPWTGAALVPRLGSGRDVRAHGAEPVWRRARGRLAPVVDRRPTIGERVRAARVGCDRDPGSRGARAAGGGAVGFAPARRCRARGDRVRADLARLLHAPGVAGHLLVEQLLLH